MTKKINPQTIIPVNAVEYHRAVEICKMRQLMRYGQEQFEEDWELAQALALLMAVPVNPETGMGSRDHFAPMLDSCFQRILAYTSNEPDAAWRLFVVSKREPYAASARSHLEEHYGVE